MKKLWNYALVFALLAAFSFSLFGCNGQDDSGHKRELAEHIAREAELEAERDEKELEINRLKGELEALSAELEEEQAKDKKYTYTFEEAYEQGKITRSDLMHFAYYRYGKVEKVNPQYPQGSYTTEIDFTPTEERGEMDTITAQRILLSTFLEQYEKCISLPPPTIEAEPTIGIDEAEVRSWFKTKNGYYIVEIYMNNRLDGGFTYKTVDDIAIFYSLTMSLLTVVKL